MFNSVITDTRANSMLVHDPKIEYLGAIFYSSMTSVDQLSTDDLKKIPALHKAKRDTAIVNFYPTDKKGANYLKYCTGWLSEDEKPLNMTQCIWQYTSDPNWFGTEINLALATDSANLKKYGSYIKHLKYSIGMSSMKFTGTVFRGKSFVSICCSSTFVSILGVDMSPVEIAAYERNNLFFIPSFTPTSTTTKPFLRKNTLIHIDIIPEWSKFCMEIQPYHTEFPEENEILFSCYNLYRYERTELMNNQRMIKLTLMDYSKHFDHHTNTILN